MSVTTAPTAPTVGDRLVIDGVERTVNDRPPVFTPLALTITFPDVAPEGTVVTILVAVHVVTAAAVPLKVTAPVPWVTPKFVPVRVTGAPIAALVILRAVRVGVAATVKLLPPLATPLTVTTTFPVVAPEGTVVLMLEALQLVTVALVPLKVTVLVP